MMRAPCGIDPSIHPTFSRRVPTLASAAVVVATKHRPKLLAGCLASLSRQEQALAEVIVVDNSAGDEETRALAERYGAIYTIARRGGLSAARNAGARQAKSEIVLFVDDDAVAEPSWSERMRAPFADERIGVVTGRVIPSEISTDVHREAIAAGTSVFMESNAFTIRAGEPDAVRAVVFGGGGIGCSMGFRRHLFERGLRFNERAGRGAAVEGSEEHLAFVRALRFGYDLAYEPAAVVRHPIPSTLEAVRSNKVRDLAAAAGYFMLLLIEVPEARRATIARLTSAARGGTGRGRQNGGGVGARLSRPRMAAAVLWGPLRYFYWRLRKPRLRRLPDA
jgi:O-antigen biosynthesis protein